MKNKLPVILVVMSFIGLMDATYLTWQHYTNGTVACSLTAGCEQVLSSRFALVNGMPISLMGGLYYLILFFLGIGLIDTKKLLFLKLIVLLSGIGLLFSSYLVYLQVLVLKSVCIYCMLSASVAVLLFVVASVNVKRYNEIK